jgi:hypothetical protein
MPMRCASSGYFLISSISSFQTVKPTHGLAQLV